MYNPQNYTVNQVTEKIDSFTNVVISSENLTK